MGKATNPINTHAVEIQKAFFEHMIISSFLPSAEYSVL